MNYFSFILVIEGVRLTAEQTTFKYRVSHETWQFANSLKRLLPLTVLDIGYQANETRFVKIFVRISRNYMKRKQRLILQKNLWNSLLWELNIWSFILSYNNFSSNVWWREFDFSSYLFEFLSVHMREGIPGRHEPPPSWHEPPILTRQI